ncbi:hypothetical protein D7Y04_07075 [Corallococcus sp. AB038B]|nr:hypothetical protein D7Y04_07075 [Corallococcus sp. AB038B]
MGTALVREPRLNVCLGSELFSRSERGSKLVNPTEVQTPFTIIVLTWYMAGSLKRGQNSLKRGQSRSRKRQVSRL